MTTTQTNSVFSSAALDLAAKYSITVCYAKAYTMDSQYVAPTRTIYVSSDSDLVHDVAHYLVASDKERDMDEFGLGASPDALKVIQPKIKGHKHKEECASLLGILLERHLGLKVTEHTPFIPKEHRDEIQGTPLHKMTWSNHSWDGCPNTKQVRKTLKTLERRGLIRKENGKFVPVL